MRRPVELIIALLGCVALAGCAAMGNAAGSGHTAGPQTAATVSVRSIAGLGRVLVSSGGLTLYVNDQEAAARSVLCAAGCTSFWIPLAPGQGAPTELGAVGKLRVIVRPDGAKQVTDDGRPLYTFVEDAPGEVLGNGVHDEFLGHRFSWHAVLAGGASAAAPATTAGGTGGY